MVAFTGCRREPLPDAGNAIRFSVGPEVLVEMQTKAALPSETDFQGLPIALYGISTKGGSSQVLFDGTTNLTYNEGKWSYSPTKYWNQGAAYNFRTVSPAGAIIDGGSASTESGKVEANYGDYDLMVASNHEITSLASTSSVAPVSLSFSHAGSAVSFGFRKGANESRTCNITSFKVDGICTTGKMTYSWSVGDKKDVITPAADASSKTTVWSWSESTDETPWSLTADYQYFDGWHLAVPQTLAGAKVHFTYKFEDESQERSATLSIPNATWQPGMVYKYQIDITVFTLGLDFTIQPWPTDDETITGTHTFH